MLKIDMWYGNLVAEADKIDVSYHPNEGIYRGNIYKDRKIIGDYACSDSIMLEKAFPHLAFNWNKEDNYHA